MNPQKRREIFERLRAQNPRPTTELRYSTPFELLVAVVLSAQATDVSVNKATAKLYPVANTPQAMLALARNGAKSQEGAILDKLLGIKDQRTDKRIDFVGGIRGLGELVKRVDSGEMQVAFALYPVTIQQLFDIADSGNVMPPKSTWFEPKLRDGLITHLIG